MPPTRIALLLALAAHGCGYGSHDVPDAAPDDAAIDACPITWIDEAPIVRSRTRFATPAITGDRDGFLFVTTARLPDGCEGPPCVLVERFGSEGAGSELAAAPFASSSDQIALFAGTDPAGAGHFAVALQVSADELVWGDAPPWRDEVPRLALDPARGLGTVAFDGERAWVLTHAWMSEGTIGEGHDYPIAPEIVRAARDGSSAIEPGPDPTEGLLFLSPELALSEGGAWLVTNGFYGGPLRAATSGWQGVLRERALSGRHAITADPSGALVVADTYDEVLAVARIHEDGRREQGAPIDAPVSAFLALARAGDRFVVATRSEGRGVRVTVLDASLAIVATASVPGTEGLGLYTELDVAGASDGTLAVMIAPPPSSPDHRAPEPVELRRFRACD